MIAPGEKKFLVSVLLQNIQTSFFFFFIYINLENVQNCFKKSRIGGTFHLWKELSCLVLMEKFKIGLTRLLLQKQFWISKFRFLSNKWANVEASDGKYWDYIFFSFWQIKKSIFLLLETEQNRSYSPNIHFLDDYSYYFEITFNL